MHEHGLINDLMRRIAQAAAAERAERVVGVSVRLGALSQISADHFRDHFIHAAEGSVAEGARLEIATSDDIHDPRAADVLLTGIEVETEG